MLSSLLKLNSGTWLKTLILMLICINANAQVNHADSARLFLIDRLDRCHKVSFVYLNGNDACNIFIPHAEGDGNNFTKITQQYRENPDSWQSNGLLIYKPTPSDSNGYAAWAYTWGVDNFGQFPGIDMGGATKLVFYLKGKGGVEILVGGTNRQPFNKPVYPYQDGVDAISSGYIELQETYTRYELDLTDFSFYVFKGVGQGFNNRFPAPFPLDDGYDCKEKMTIIPASVDENGDPAFEVRWAKPVNSPCWAGFFLMPPIEFPFAADAQGYNLTNLDTIIFRAKMTKSGWVRFLFGRDNDSSGNDTMSFYLTPQWGIFKWIMPKQNYQNIIAGFGLAVAPDIGTPDSVSIFLDWVKYSGIELAHDYNRLITGFKIVAPKIWNQDSAIVYFDSIYFNRPRLDEPRLQQSFVMPNSDTLFQSQQSTGHVYDASLMAIAFLAEYYKTGNPSWLNASEKIGDAFLFAMENDRYFSDGRLRNVYSAGLLYDVFNKARLPGYWNEMTGDTGRWFEDIYDVSTYTGNVAWAALSILSLYEATDSIKYLLAAEHLAKWAIDSTWGDRGFTAGYKGWEGNQLKLQYTATEHCIDLYALFTRLFDITHKPVYKFAAEHADLFVNSMWDPVNGKFFTGTDYYGLGINTSVVPTDLQAWYPLAYNLRNSDFTRGYHWAKDSCYVESHTHINDPHAYKGYDFSLDSTLILDGIGYEFTGQMATCACWLGDTIFYHEMLDEIEYIQVHGPHNNGKGIVAACHDSLTTGFDWEYHNILHAGGATLWYLFAKERIDPYYNPKFPFDCNIHVSTHTIAGSPYNISIAPNPSRGLVDISFGLSSSQYLTIEVFDLNSKPIRVLAKNQSYQPGSYRLHLDATEVPDGVYIISFQSTSGKVTEKLVVSH